MEKRETIVKGFYAQYKEENRLDASKQGRVEFATTMHYIHKFLEKGMKVVEIGAGTGRISIDLAKEGFNVTAVEYSDANFEKLKENADGIENIEVHQGDAVNLDILESDTYDVTLLFGPMYHLYSEEEQLAALAEARRITKKGGKILIAFISAYAIMDTNYLCEMCDTFDVGLKENFTEDYKVKHFPEQLFTGFDIVEFEELVEKAGLKRLTTVAADGVLELAERRSDFNLEGELFDKYLRYHLALCEKRELLGHSSHLIAVCENA